MMHSYLCKSCHISNDGRVLILVVMDDALVLYAWDYGKVLPADVLILVVMDDALVLSQLGGLQGSRLWS